MAVCFLAVSAPALAGEASTNYFVATTDQGLGIAVDLDGHDATSDRLRAALPAGPDRLVATVALVNRTDHGERIPVLFAEGSSGRVVVLRSPTGLLQRGGRRWWQQQRREPLVLSPGRSVTIYRVGAGATTDETAVIRAWVRGRLVATMGPAAR